MSTRRKLTTPKATELDMLQVKGRSILVDLDHTIADAYWRDVLIGKWDDYYLASVDDEPFFWVRELLHGLSGIYNLVCVTARPEKWRTLTMKWMLKHKIPMDELLMRPDNDHRPGVLVKLSLINARFSDLKDIAFAMDDKIDVCEAYWAVGINALQVRRALQIGAPT